ncbi:glycosyltransferase, partial [Bartonella tamiae]|uniref:glycosyltransferase n=1 Tax=Bartonella tamiae TaxID=373638 RepID=UPI00058748B1
MFIFLCYNQCNEIDAVLESIFNQDLICIYEVIVSDDGSDDGTNEKFLRWKSQYPDIIKLIVQQRDPQIEIPLMERIKNFNECALKNISGKYFCLFDGDDYCLSKEFSKDAIEIMDNDDSISSVVFNFEYRFPNKLQIANYVDINDNKLHEGIVNRYDFICKNYAHSGTFVFRNQLSSSQIKKLASVPFLIDNTIVPFMFQFGELYYKPKLAYSYRVSGGHWDIRPKKEKSVFTILVAAMIAHIAPEFEWAFKRRIVENYDFICKNRKLLKLKIDENIF